MSRRRRKGLRWAALRWRDERKARRNPLESVWHVTDKATGLCGYEHRYADGTKTFSLCHAHHHLAPNPQMESLVEGHKRCQAMSPGIKVTA